LQSDPTGLQSWAWSAQPLVRTVRIVNLLVATFLTMGMAGKVTQHTVNRLTQC
jgi:hypothetical protein